MGSTGAIHDKVNLYKVNLLLVESQLGIACVQRRHFLTPTSVIA